MTQPTHYEVLALPKSLIDDASPDQIPLIVKQAYHRALLRHHPDKSSKGTTPSSVSSASTPAYTIDQITQAHATLSNQTLRAAYDAQIRTLNINNTAPDAAFQTGIETLDLDDLNYDDVGVQPQWYRSCRCGNPRGFVVGEPDLEEAGDLGELLVGCQDCSLWLRVCFAVVDDADDQDGAGAESQHNNAGNSDADLLRDGTVP